MSVQSQIDAGAIKFFNFDGIGGDYFQAEHLAKRKELWGMRNLGGTNCSTKKPQHEKGFAQETAEATGSTRQQINRAISRAEGVTEEARDAIRGTELDKGTVLDELKKVPPAEQMDRVLIVSHSRG